jgi:hypothetical protein
VARDPVVDEESTLNFYGVGEKRTSVFQLKFGPSAWWYAIEKDSYWTAAPTGARSKTVGHIVAMYIILMYSMRHGAATGTDGWLPYLAPLDEMARRR